MTVEVNISSKNMCTISVCVSLLTFDGSMPAWDYKFRSRHAPPSMKFGFPINSKDPRGGGGHLYFRLDIIRVKGLSKHTLNMYFSGMKIDPKYVFFFNLSVMSFPKFVIWPKIIPFFPILHVFAPLNDVRAYIAWFWKTTLITWIFLRGWYPTITSGPPGKRSQCSQVFKNATKKNHA